MIFDHSFFVSSLHMIGSYSISTIASSMIIFLLNLLPSTTCTHTMSFFLLKALSHCGTLHVYVARVFDVFISCCSRSLCIHVLCNFCINKDRVLLLPFKPSSQWGIFYFQWWILNRVKHQHFYP